MDRAVGLIFFSRYKGRLAAVMRKRGNLKVTDDLTLDDETRPGGTQAFIHGGLKPPEGDDYQRGLAREAEEEAGDRIAMLLLQRLEDLTELYRDTKPGKEVVTYGLFLPDINELVFARSNIESGEVVLVYADTPLEDLSKYPKDVGVTDRRVVAVFKDNEAALRKGFELYADAA
jgi:hypothetical protein